MASVSKRDIPEVANMMPQLWETIKEFYIPEPNDRYWEELNERCEQIYRECPSRLTFHLLYGFRNYLQEKQLHVGGMK